MGSKNNFCEIHISRPTTLLSLSVPHFLLLKPVNAPGLVVTASAWTVGIAFIPISSCFSLGMISLLLTSSINQKSSFVKCLEHIDEFLVNSHLTRFCFKFSTENVVTNEQMLCGRDTGSTSQASSSQSVNCSFFVLNMAENGLFWAILSSDKNKTKHGIRFISSQNVLDMHTFSKFIKTV